MMDGVSRGLMDSQARRRHPAPGRRSGRPADRGDPGGRSRLRHRPRGHRDGKGVPALEVRRLRPGHRRVDAARAEAAALGLTNAAFETLDVAALPAAPPFDAICAFDAIHDQADPGGVLARAHAALGPGGTLLMMDVKAASDLADNLDDPFDSAYIARKALRP